MYYPWYNNRQPPTPVDVIARCPMWGIMAARARSNPMGPPAQVAQPYVYAHSLPDVLLPAYGAAMLPLVRNEAPAGAANSSTAVLLSAAGARWLHVVKSPNHTVRYGAIWSRTVRCDGKTAPLVAVVCRGGPVGRAPVAVGLYGAHHTHSVSVQARAAHGCVTRWGGAWEAASRRKPAALKVPRVVCTALHHHRSPRWHPTPTPQHLPHLPHAPPLLPPRIQRTTHYRRCSTTSRSWSPFWARPWRGRRGGWAAATPRSARQRCPSPA